MSRLNNYIRNQNGIFLAELIVSMIVMVIIMGAIFGIMSAVSKSFLYNTAQSRNIAAARDILDNVTSELRYATVTYPALGQSDSHITYSVMVNSLPQARTISTTPGNPATTSSLVISYSGSPYRTIAINNLQSITFQRDATNPQLMTISIVLNNQSYTGSPAFPTTTTVIMPNTNI